MRALVELQWPNRRQTGIIVLAALVSVILGLSILVYNSPLAPLIVLGVIVAAAFGLASLRTPILVLCAALVVNLLPNGLIPASLNSILNRSLTLVALGVWALDMTRRRSRLVWPSAIWLMSGFLVWSLLTLFWTPNLDIGRDTLVKYLLRSVLFLLLISNEVNTWKTLRGLMYTLALIGWIFVVAGIGTALFEGYVTGTRLQVLGGNENTAGDLFPVGVIGVLWLAIESPNRQMVFLGLVYLFLSCVLVALGGSRGGAITWVTIMVAFLFWRRTRWWGIAGLLILALTALSGTAIFRTTIDRFLGKTGETPLGGREALWQGAWLLIRDHPWGGVGIGNASREVVQYARLFRSMWGIESASLHNPVLTIWAETGIPGVMLYLGVLVSSVVSFVLQYLRARKQGRGQLLSYFALVGSVLLGYMVSWTKGGGAESSYSYFLMLGLLLIPSCLRVEVSG
jgi:O-antigen ligase